MGPARRGRGELVGRVVGRRALVRVVRWEFVERRKKPRPASRSVSFCEVRRGCV